MIEFDLIECPLAGINLIEAAAGTGKTYAVAGLYVRLVVEKGLTPGQILVMTYTVAATDELKGRIRKNLKDAVSAFAEGSSGDPFLEELAAYYPDERDRHAVRSRLQDSLRNFDEAAVYTIHGFCQRMLQEHAFESGTFFDAGMVTDQGEIKREIVEDFWRTHLYEAFPEIGGYVLSKGLHPEALYGLVTDKALNDDIRIVPDAEVPPMDDIKALLAAIKADFSRLAAAWPEAREEVRGKLTDPGIKANIYGQRVDRFITAVDGYLSSRGRYFLPPDELDKFTTERLACSMKKGCAPPVHAVFPLCQSIRERADALKKLLDRYLLFLKAELIRTVRRELPARKTEMNVLFYDDLLTRLKSALTGKTGGTLAAAIREKYKAALVDEFQDTDPAQYAIIQSVFGEGDSILFLIGDPKQAIYSFRGADLFAYMKAAAHVDARYGMRKNWRADPKLIGAVNALFSRRENPFLYDEIGFYPAEAGDPSGRGSCRLGPQEEAPLTLWFVPSESDQPMSKQAARQRVTGAVAAEISRLLDLARQGKTRIGDQPLAAGDIAVLVRKNREVVSMQDALRSLGIPCVVSSADNIFASCEAEEIELILAAAAEPGNERKVRRALATGVMGVSGSELDRLMTDEAAWGGYLERFKRYHELWRERGFMKMFRQWLSSEGVRGRLLALRDGERRLTNLLQLSEILHRETAEGNLGMTGLLKWLAAQRRQEGLVREEHQMRLESDDNAVKIITVHKSKGLEYPVVFCPFAWDGADIRKTPFLFHDEGADRLPVCDLGSERVDENREYAVRELLGENIRLLYVALTRARNRCYFVWGRFNQAGTSAPFYLLHGRQQPTADGFIPAMVKDFKALSDKDMFEEVVELAGQSGGCLSVSIMPEGRSFPHSRSAGEKEMLACRTFGGRIDRSWKVTSFSFLVSGRPQSTDLPDHDSLAAEDAPGPFTGAGEDAGRRITGDILDFPRGARAGTCLHALMERLDFRNRDDETTSLTIRNVLTEHGFDPDWEGAVLRMFNKMIDCPLDAAPDPLKLSSIGSNERMDEMGFYFPLRPISPQSLSGLFADCGIGGIPDVVREQMGRLRFSTTSGYMRGFMDMIFRHRDRYFLVDWKSNYLGDRLESYNREAISGIMSGSFYFLQYHLYTVALHRYLDARLPGYEYGRHFGGVYYLFLRGLDPSSGPACGVYYDLPAQKNIETLCSKLIADS